MRLTIRTLNQMKKDKHKIVMLTSYDASFARLADDAGADVLLVGDSLGMVIQGHDSTVPVTVSDIVYHCAAVSRGSSRALIIGDMPYLSYTSPDQALRTAARIMQEGGVQMVKLEGGDIQVEQVKLLSAHGVSVCAHLGLTPQSVNRLGGYTVQGRSEAAAAQMLSDAQRLQDAGAQMMVLECIPTPLAQRITETLEIPIIGIGAGKQCDGQVLVIYDVLGLSSGKLAKFAKNFMNEAPTPQAALKKYVEDVRAGVYPGVEHSY